MHHWILILMLRFYVVDSAAAVTVGPYATQQNCEQAAYLIYKSDETVKHTMCVWVDGPMPKE